MKFKKKNFIIIICILIVGIVIIACIYLYSNHLNQIALEREFVEAQNEYQIFVEASKKNTKNVKEKIQEAHKLLEDKPDVEDQSKIDDLLLLLDEIVLVDFKEEINTTLEYKNKTKEYSKFNEKWAEEKINSIEKSMEEVNKSVNEKKARLKKEEERQVKEKKAKEEEAKKAQEQKAKEEALKKAQEQKQTLPSDLSKGNLILVNKQYCLKSDYVPSNLVKIEKAYGYTYYLKSEVYEAFKRMADDAKKEGLTLFISSPYRSYSTQQTLFNNYAARDGIKNASRYSARPGCSEHQAGLAIDIVKGNGYDLGSFGSSKQFTWMSQHAAEYGFILRYPSGKEHITGYMYEPWHYRYLGVEYAKRVKESNLTYDEYYNEYIK